MNIDAFTDAIASGTVEEIKNTRQNRRTHIQVLREVTAPARFTTDGERGNTMTVRMGRPGEDTVETRAVDLFYRKQPGAERRTAKSLQRDVLGGESDPCKEDRMHPNNMRQNTPESVLFGSAAGNQGVSQRSRVYYNSAYSLRDASVTLQQNTQTAAGDETRQEATEGQGTWTPDFVQPGTMFPSVVTLDSAIPEEVLFVLAVLDRTNHYGAGETRGGNVTNHVLGVHAGHDEGPANLEVARETVAELTGDEFAHASDVVEASTLPLDDVKEATISAYDHITETRGLEFDVVSESEITEVLTALRDGETLHDIMAVQLDAVEDYVSRAPGGD